MLDTDLYHHLKQALFYFTANTSLPNPNLASNSFQRSTGKLPPDA
jgi:hypothetical protein